MATTRFDLPELQPLFFQRAMLFIFDALMEPGAECHRYEPYQSRIRNIVYELHRHTFGDDSPFPYTAEFIVSFLVYIRKTGRKATKKNELGRDKMRQLCNAPGSFEPDLANGEPWPVGWEGKLGQANIALWATADRFGSWALTIPGVERAPLSEWYRHTSQLAEKPASYTRMTDEQWAARQAAAAAAHSRWAAHERQVIATVSRRPPLFPDTALPFRP